jgi:hypothetical protein
MKIATEKVKEVIVGKNEAGMFEFKDTGTAIEMGDKAFVVKSENPFSGTTDNVYFKNKENADKHN